MSKSKQRPKLTPAELADDARANLAVTEDMIEEDSSLITSMMEKFTLMQQSFMQQQIQMQQEREDRKDKQMSELLFQQEEERRKTQLMMEEKLREREEASRARDRRLKMADKIVPWKDTDVPDAYLGRFEHTMGEAAIPRKEWPNRLINLLTGKALDAYHKNVSSDHIDDYNTLKEALLQALGLSQDKCTREFWNLRRAEAESPQDLSRKLEHMIDRITFNCTTLKEAKQTFAMGKFLSMYSAEDAEFVRLRQPTSLLHAANIMDDHIATKQQARERRPQWRPWGREGFRQQKGDEQQPEARDGAAKGQRSRLEAGPTGQGGRPATRDGPRNGYDMYRVPTCFNCGRKGHKRPECPQKVGLVKVPSRQADLYVSGCIGRHPCNMKIDTGAGLTVVDTSLVEPLDYTGKHILLTGFSGKAIKVPLAKVWVHVGEYDIPHTVAAVEKATEPVLLGMDLGILDYLLDLERKVRREMEEREKALLTRAQAAEEAAEEAQDVALSEQSGAEPIDITKEFDFHEDLFCTDSGGEDSVQAVPEGEAYELPLPVLPESVGDSALLVEQQLHDESLAPLRALAELGETEYYYKQGVLMHKYIGDAGEEFERIVLPKERRRDVLRLAHSDNLGGHFSYRKTNMALKRLFTWPGVSKDIKHWCSTCPSCQKAGKAQSKRAPLQPLPVISTPFSRIAFDLVGPLPRTKRGFKYILTCMCLGSKYPEAIPLKRVDAHAVAEAMMEIFSRTGIPSEILTDQGSVFMGKLNQKLCSLLNITHLKTSPYHPQTDGTLERWHGSLKAMLRKCDKRKSEWDLLLKYFLFAYRNSPHTNTGFSPFEILLGRPVRGPLDVLREGWLSEELPIQSVVTWVDDLREHLHEMTSVVIERETIAKSKMKAQYDKKAREREFQEGSLVLVRTPDLSGKLDDVWDGPYEISRKISSVTYELSVPNRRSKRRVVHINMLKEWKPPDTSVLHVVVAEDEAEEVMESPIPELPAEQQADLDHLLAHHNEVVCERTGRVTTTFHGIDTGTANPIRSCPYRLAPAWRDQLREEVRSLVASGILKPSLSPWSSPMVPVRKPDGSVRLCIDFRKVNAVTSPDPYQMPRIEDMIDQLGSARFLSKLDLNKGFYQIPLKKADQCKTAFCTPWGKFEFTMMPFGLRNAPATFQRLMHTVLADLYTHSNAYMDDIIIFSLTWPEHLTHVQSVLSRLSQYGLTAKPSKCRWGTASLSFLGHTVGRGMVSVPDCKVDSIKSYIQPRTKKDIQSFLGTTGYYRKFIPAYAQHSLALTDATKKAASNDVNWNDTMYAEFCYLRDALCHICSLTIPNDSDNFLLQTDASSRGIASVLNVCRDGAEMPVAFYSKKLQPAETRYSATELECLAIIRSIQHFGVYLVGKHFTVETDHRALQFLHSSKHLNGRLTRWALLLQPYSFTIRYRPGKKNANADGLSRQAWPSDEDIRPCEEGGDVRLPLTAASYLHKQEQHELL